jgi:ribonuclease D
MIVLIDSYDALRDFAIGLPPHSRAAVDTEAASFHRYSDRVCLIQVSVDGVSAVIDVLALKDLEPLRAILAGSSREKILHDADSDLRALDRDFGFRVERVFDTRIAAQLLGEPGIGLAALLEKYFGTKLDKRYQRADWSIRPLTAPMIEYAAADTRQLSELRDVLERELLAKGRHAWATEEFSHLGKVRWTPRDPEEEAYSRLKGVRTLSHTHKHVARALYAWRDTTAKAMDRAPFRVLGNEYIVEIARVAPTDLAKLGAVPRMPGSIVTRHGVELVGVVNEALHSVPDDVPRARREPRARPDPAIETRLTRLKTLRTAQSALLGLEAGVLCPNATLFAIAEANPRRAADLDHVNELRLWQREAMGEQQILTAVAG